MEIRHLRCFLALAEELHFTRAAERLNIEQPPLSRAIKELEDELGAVLFDRDRRGTRLTAAGTTFLQDVRRLFTDLKQARENVRAVAAGLRGSLHIAVSDGAINPRLSAFLAHCREEEPEIEIRLTEVTLAEQLRGLRSGQFNVGFAHTADVGDDLITEAVWHDPLVLVIPKRHPLLAHKAVPLDDLGRYPLVLCDPQACEGYDRELTRLLRQLKREPEVIKRVSSLNMMLALVGAGYGVSFTTATQIPSCQRPDVVIRPLAEDSAVITTYLLRLDGDGSSAPPERLIGRLREHGD